MESTPTQSVDTSESDSSCVRAVVLHPAQSVLLQMDGVTEENTDGIFLQLIQNMYRDVHLTRGLRGVQVKASHYTQEACVVVIEEWQTLTDMRQAFLQHGWQSASDEIQPLLAKSATVLGPYRVALLQEPEQHVYEYPSLPSNFAYMLLPAPLGEHLLEEEIAVLQQATGTIRKAIMQALFAEVMP